MLVSYISLVSKDPNKQKSFLSLELVKCNTVLTERTPFGAKTLSRSAYWKVEVEVECAKD